MSEVSSERQSISDETFEGEVEEEEEPKNAEEQYGAAEEHAKSDEISSAASSKLKEDFCEEEPGEGEEEEEEASVEEVWVCEGVEEESPFYGEGCLCDAEFGEEEEEDFLSVKSRRSLDSDYLKAVLGAPLTYALADIATKRPTDPIQYLSFYLVRWKYGYINNENFKCEMEELTKEREAYIAKLKEKERQEMLKKEEKEEEKRRAERLESSIEDSDFGEEVELLGESKL